MLTTSKVYADAEVTRRRNCTWYQSKFKTHAKIKHCGVLEKFEANQKDCGGTLYSWCESYSCNNAGRDMVPREVAGSPYTPLFLNGTRLWENAKAYAETGYNTSSPLGWVATVFGTYGSYKTKGGNCTSGSRFCVGNDDNAVSYISPQPIVEPVEPSKAFNAASSSATYIDFDESGRKIIVRGFKAVLRNFPYDRQNDYSAISLNVYNSPADSIDNLIRSDDNEFRKRVLLKSRVLLNNGRLTIDGALQNASISTKDSSGVQIVELILDEIVLKVDVGVDPDNISVTAGGDVGNLGYGISDRYKPGEQGKVYEISTGAGSPDVLTFANYSNPVTNGSFDAELELSAAENVTVGLYDPNGNVVRNIYSGVIQPRNRRRFNVSTNGLNSGTYYLRVVGNSRSLSRRVIIQ